MHIFYVMYIHIYEYRNIFDHLLTHLKYSIPGMTTQVSLASKYVVVHFHAISQCPGSHEQSMAFFVSQPKFV